MMTKDYLWNDYLKTKAFKDLLFGFNNDVYMVGDSIDKEALYDELLSLDYKEGMKRLKVLLHEEVVLKIRSRFRTYKYRKQNNKKTVLMNDDTHTKIMNFSKAVGTETFDEALDYLINERYGTIIRESAEDFLDAPYIDKELHIKSLLTSKPLYEKTRIVRIIQFAFESGWRSAKRSRSKRINAIDEGFDRFFKSKIR